jgi:hypothetical protein
VALRAKCKSFSLGLLLSPLITSPLLTAPQGRPHDFSMSGICRLCKYKSPSRQQQPSTEQLSPSIQAKGSLSARKPGGKRVGNMTREKPQTSRVPGRKRNVRAPKNPQRSPTLTGVREGWVSVLRRDWHGKTEGALSDSRRSPRNGVVQMTGLGRSLRHDPR